MEEKEIFVWKLILFWNEVSEENMSRSSVVHPSDKSLISWPKSCVSEWVLRGWNLAYRNGMQITLFALYFQWKKQNLWKIGFVSNDPNGCDN